MLQGEEPGVLKEPLQSLASLVTDSTIPECQADLTSIGPSSVTPVIDNVEFYNTGFAIDWQG